MERENYKTPIFTFASFWIWLLLINTSTILIYYYSDDPYVTAIFASFMFVGLLTMIHIHEYEDMKTWIETIEKVEEKEEETK